MQKRLEEMRVAWRAEGRNELKVRMGLNTGKAVAGNMGSHTRMNYTVMGDSVNLASRLEGANKYYGTYTMASEYTWRATKDAFRYRELDTIRVVGKAEPIRVFELIGLKGGLSDVREATLARFDTGITLYRQRRWKEALTAFASALRADMADGPSRVYYARCRKFLSSPPSADWDGVSTLSSK
jgi:adenylate cyclase